MTQVDQTELSENEKLARDLEKIQKLYFDNVDRHFRESNIVRGRAAFASWERQFLDFIDTNLPGFHTDYQSYLSSNTGAALAMQTAHQNWKRQRGEAVESFLEQAILDARAGNLLKYVTNKRHPHTQPSDRTFVDQNRIEELRKIQSGNYDLSRLIRLCEELNNSLSTGALYAIAMLTRSLIDHVPPIFGQASFSGVANNYGGTSSFRQSMTHLDETSRKIADMSLHTQIRSSETLLTPTQVNFSQELDVLLAEIVRILKI